MYDSSKSYCLVVYAELQTNLLARKTQGNHVNFDNYMVTCRETAHRIGRVFAIMQPP